MSVARVVLPAQRGGLFEQLSASWSRRSAQPCRAEAHRGASGAGVAAPARRTGILQWPRRLRQERNRICDGARAGPIDAGAVDQRHRQSEFGFQAGPRAAAILGRSTAARTRSRPGRTIRSATEAAKRSICATTRPAISGARPRCRSATQRGPIWRAMGRLQPVRACRARDRVRSRGNMCRSTIR